MEVLVCALCTTWNIPINIILRIIIDSEGCCNKTVLIAQRNEGFGCGTLKNIHLAMPTGDSYWEHSVSVQIAGKTSLISDMFWAEIQLVCVIAWLN